MPRVATAGSFKPGQCGNPKGRPKALVSITELARARTEKNLRNLAYWADQRDDGAIAVRANIALHEIAWGKPAQAITGADGGPIILKWEE